MSSPPASPLSAARAAVAAAKERLLAAMTAPSSAIELLSSVDARRTLERELQAALEVFGAVVFDALASGAARLDEGGHRVEPSRLPASAPLSVAVARVIPAEAVPPPAPKQPEPPPPVPAAAPPAREEPKREPAPAVPVTPEVIDRLRGRLGSTLSEEPAAIARTLGPHELEVVKDAVIRLGASPEVLPDPAAVTSELITLERAGTELRHWGRLPAAVNHATTTWLVSRARALQDALKVHPDPQASRRTDALFRQMTEHSNATRPGVIHGLARAHRPLSESWAADAKDAERSVRSLVGAGPIEVVAAPKNFDDELRRLAEEVRGGLAGAALVERMRRLVADGLSPQDTRLVRLATTVITELDGKNALNRLRKAAIKIAEEETEQETDATARTLVPDDWPHWDKVRGKSVVIVGGEPRAERVARLRDIFGFGKLEWLDGAAASGRTVDSLVRRMRSGSVEIVIVLRAFSSHKLSDKVFKSEMERCVRVLADTYGVLQVRLGLERFMNPRGT